MKIEKREEGMILKEWEECGEMGENVGSWSERTRKKEEAEKGRAKG